MTCEPGFPWIRKRLGCPTIEEARAGGKSSRCRGSGKAVDLPFEVEGAVLATMRS